MNVDLFDFDLPEDRIALRPVRPRDAARLLVVAPGAALQDRVVRDLPELLRPGDALVVNDTKVIPAELRGERSRGGTSARIAATLLKRIDPSRWQAFARPAKRLTPGDQIRFGAVSEQFTRFGTLQDGGTEVPNPTGQYENSSITQLVSGYQLTTRFALQLNVPLIYREFKRPEGFEIQQGTVSGLGDMSLLLKTVFFHYASPAERSFDVSGKNPIATVHESDFTVSAVLLTGIKFPTGDSSRLEEEFHETEIPGAPESAIHGHDLTLGTGSYDGIFGEQTSLRYKKMFLETNVQFAARTEGTHDYRFADDLTILLLRRTAG
jgi:hypothetical protein